MFAGLAHFSTLITPIDISRLPISYFGRSCLQTILLDRPLHSITLLHHIRQLSCRCKAWTPTYSFLLWAPITPLRVVKLHSSHNLNISTALQHTLILSLSIVTGHSTTMQPITVKNGLIAFFLLQASNAHMGITNFYVDGVDQVQNPSSLTDRH